jgi:5-methyltetrahydrofolate--homocysteine methyltransferase
MIYNARQLEKAGIKIPLLIGGAATSRLHTALKIDPEYSGAVVHVGDASRVAELCHKLLSDKQPTPNPFRRSGGENDAGLRPATQSAEGGETHRVAMHPTESGSSRGSSAHGETWLSFISQTKAAYAQLRANYSQNSPANLTPLSQARAQAPAIPPAPRVPGSFGIRQLEPPLSILVNFIDWSPFFWAWGIHGVHPKILSNPEAQKLFNDAQKILQEIVTSGRVQPKGVIGFWPAFREGDSIIVKPEDEKIERFHFLRQQRPSGANPAYQCLADFIAPEKDSLGGFVVTATGAIDLIAREFSERGNDYSALIVKALGNRIVEAFAEYAHIQARRIWGHPPTREATADFGANQSQNLADLLPDLLAQRYQGIRPAIGYPCIPDHTEKAALWRLLDAGSSTGARLTENFAMTPASTVCGLYFHHAEAKYFNVGKIGEDQLADYAARKGWTLDEARKWLSGVL